MPQRMLKWVRCVPMLIGVLASNGCGDDDPDDSDERSEESAEMVGRETGAECPTGSTLTYDNFGRQFMSDYCLRCHSTRVTGKARQDAPGDHNFDTLADLDLFAKHIDGLAGSGPDATNVEMPPSEPKPTQAEREKLSEWIACDLPE